MRRRECKGVIALSEVPAVLRRALISRYISSYLSVVSPSFLSTMLHIQLTSVTQDQIWMPIVREVCYGRCRATKGCQSAEGVPIPGHGHSTISRTFPQALEIIQTKTMLASHYGMSMSAPSFRNLRSPSALPTKTSSSPSPSQSKTVGFADSPTSMEPRLLDTSAHHSQLRPRERDATGLEVKLRAWARVLLRLGAEGVVRGSRKLPIRALQEEAQAPTSMRSHLGFHVYSEYS